MWQRLQAAGAAWQHAWQHASQPARNQTAYRSAHSLRRSHPVPTLQPPDPAPPGAAPAAQGATHPQQRLRQARHGLPARGAAGVRGRREWVGWGEGRLGVALPGQGCVTHYPEARIAGRPLAATRPAACSLPLTATYSALPDPEPAGRGCHQLHKGNAGRLHALRHGERPSLLLEGRGSGEVALFSEAHQLSGRPY